MWRHRQSLDALAEGLLEHFQRRVAALRTADQGRAAPLPSGALLETRLQAFYAHTRQLVVERRLGLLARAGLAQRWHRRLLRAGYPAATARSLTLALVLHALVRPKD